MLHRSTAARALLVTAALCVRVAHGEPVEADVMRVARDMGIGWNLGNTLDATGINGKSVREFETAWGNPAATKQLFDGIKAAGFKSVRIPVAWFNLIGPDDTINAELMARVEEVAGYALDNDLYVILNIHWDGGWITRFSTEYEPTMGKYKALWRQIANRFKDRSDRLIFESMNEEGHFDDLWNRWGGMPNQKEKAYAILNAVNQEFVNLIRASGGRNARRCLLIAGYATDIRATVDPAFKMPTDRARRSIVSVHYYDPYAFTILEADTQWAKVAHTWGTPAEVQAVKTDMLAVKRRFIDHGVPVVLGEFGCSSKKDPASTLKYLTTVCETAYSMGIVPMLWDPGDLYDRNAFQFRNAELGNAFRQIAATPRP